MSRQSNRPASDDQDPEAHLAAARASAARSRRWFTVSLVISIVLVLAYPTAWVAVILLFDSATDVGQGFYLVWIWILLFPLLAASVIFTAITWARRISAKKTAAAAEQWAAARRP